MLHQRTLSKGLSTDFHLSYHQHIDRGFIQVIFKQRTYLIFKRFIYQYGHKMYILVVYWLEQFCVFLKALSRYRFIARDEHQQLEFLPSEFSPIGFLKGFVDSVETHSSIISWSHQPFSWYMTLARR